MLRFETIGLKMFYVEQWKEGNMKKRIYSIWHNMKTRCYNTKNEHYKWYGGRGITVCDEWQRFAPFYSWAVSHGYNDSLTLDRKDNNGNYEPSNCRWVDARTQNNNTRKNRYITHYGVTKTSAQWARQYGVEPHVFNNRIRRGWPFERAIKKR